MEWFSAPDYRLARLLVERGLGLCYLVAFLVALNQFPALLGEHGLLPVPRYLRRVSFRQAPSLFHLHYSDRFLGAVAWLGILLAAAMLLGLPQAGPLWLPMLAWLVLWVLYLSIVNVGQQFYSFGWESLLLEAGFLADLPRQRADRPAAAGPAACSAGWHSGWSSARGSSSSAATTAGATSPAWTITTRPSRCRTR